MTLQFAQIDDEQGKFNINTLAAGGKTDTEAVAKFERLPQLTIRTVLSAAVRLQQSCWWDRRPTYVAVNPISDRQTAS